MKKLLLLALSVAGLSAYAFPTYEPFSEFGNLVATSGSNMVCTLAGVAVPSSATGQALFTNGVTAYSPYLNQCIDFSSGGLTDPMGEAWTTLNFGGTNKNGLAPNGVSGAAQSVVKGLDVAIIQDTLGAIFPNSTVSSILPSTFPGFPATGAAITNMILNCSQPGVFTNNSFNMNPWICGNSAVLNLSQDITRPGSGSKTIYISYLFYLVQQGQLGSGNDGRYLAFICQSNMSAGVNSSSSYTYWSQMFNTYNTTTAPKIAYHGLLLKSGSGYNGTYYIGACDSSAGKAFATTPVFPSFGAPVFVVGAYQMNATGSDTNYMWANPATSSLGGATPPAVNVHAFTMTNRMPDIAGIAFISRVGNGGAGGVGTNYIANLIVGNTWSYVTGGPEFTNSPANVNIFGYGANVSFTGAAIAAGQSVSYQWLHVVGSTTNVLSDGSPTWAGGSATVSGSQTNTLTLNGVNANDVQGIYLLVATASSTGYQLSSPAQIVYHTDPFIAINPPANASVIYSSNTTIAAQVTTSQSSLFYQWYNGAAPLANGVQTDGSILTNATGTVSGLSGNSTVNLVLGMANAKDGEAGNYSVWVTNNVNFAVQSTPETLSVVDPYIYLQMPAKPVYVSQSGSLSLTIGAVGSGLSYQWNGNSQGTLANGANFNNVTTPTLAITGAQLANADTYYCTVTSTNGNSTNSIGKLVIVDYVPTYPIISTNGPFSQTNDWPPTVSDNESLVDYAIWDPYATFGFPSSWNNILSVPPSGGDQTWSQTTLGGELGYDFNGTYLNIADRNWRNFVNVPQIDILLNVYGNSSMYNSDGTPRAITFSYGNVAIATYIHGSSFSPGANNGQWNWLLLTVTNVIDINGYRIVGDPTYGTGGNGGINSGTIRIEGFNSSPGLVVRAVAMGPHGVFGTTNQINRFAAPANCSPEPTNNLAWIDFNLGTSNNLSVMNNANIGETYIVQTGVGPAGDLRTAIQSSGYMEMPILNNYLGQPCNQNLTMQVCIEFYDDPALAGNSFGPYQYASDYQGDLANYTGAPYTMTGSGQWLKVAFYVGPLNLNGVNTTPLTGGPLMVFNGAVPYVDRVEVGLIRTGTNALAGQIPDPNYLLNPLVTAGTNSGYYAEWYPSASLYNNVNASPAFVTTSGGPANDQRICLQPQSISGDSASYLIWYLQNNVFGDTYQDNADVVMDLTYYDDPALAGSILYPNVNTTLINGSQSIVTSSAQPVTLQGSGQWKEALFELPNVNFAVSPGSSSPQYVCRYAASAPVMVCRVRYDVIRPAGPFEGINYLQRLGLSATNSNVSLSWRGTGKLLSSQSLSGTFNSLVSTTNILNNFYTVPATNRAAFYRLQFPAYPSYLSIYPPNPY